MEHNVERARVLLVDDDSTFRNVLSKELERHGYSMTVAANGRECIERATAPDFDVMLLDLKLPDIDGIEVLRRVCDNGARSFEIIIVTGHGTIDTAIEATKLGAYDYVEKPCPTKKIAMTIDQARERLALLNRKQVLEDGFASRNVDADFIGDSAHFQELKSRIYRVAPTDSSILILGETGVGKERVARLIHAHSTRQRRPFVVVDCGAIHDNLLQSELFGHEKGAYTGAVRRKHGLFEVADTGTIFLDEVGDLSLETQVKLLRTIESGSFRRLGGTKELKVDVRVLSATNRDIEDRMSKGHFREDLFFRLGTIKIEVPPLRARGEDIVALVSHYADRFNKRFGKSVRFDEDAMRTLVEHEWPGNVRELMNVVEQAVVLSTGSLVTAEQLPIDLVRRGLPGWHPPGDEVLSLGEVERRYIEYVLRKQNGHRANTAKALEISVRNLYRKLAEYGLDDIPSIAGPPSSRKDG